MKEGNEERTRGTLLDNRGVLSMDQIKDIFYIVDEPYSRNVGRDGKPWYGKLIKRNAKRLFKEDIVKIDKWVNLIINCVMSIMSPIKIIDNLSDTRNHLHLDGANFCCITLILNLIDKPN